MLTSDARKPSDKYVQLSTYADAVNDLNQKPINQFTDDDCWLQANNYIRLARGFEEISRNDLACNAYNQALEWLIRIEQIKENQIPVIAMIYQQLKNMYAQNPDVYNMFHTIEMILSQPDYHIGEDLEKYFNEEQLAKLEKNYPELLLQFFPLSFTLIMKIHTAGLLPNEETNKLIKDTCEKIASAFCDALGDYIKKLFDWTSLPHEERVRTLRKRPDDMSSSMQNLRSLNAGVMTRSQKRKLEASGQVSGEIGFQPSKRPA